MNIQYKTGFRRVKNKLSLIYFLLFFGFIASSFGQQCQIVYVTPNGASTGAAGTPSNPANLAYGLTLASPANPRMHLSGGTYNISSEFIMISGITIEGGFDPSNNWLKTNGATTTIFRDNSNPTPNPARLVAVSCIGISNFRFQDVKIQVASAFGGGVSTYGVYLNNCSDYNFTRCKIISGNAGDGDTGALGADGLPGAIGSMGQSGDEDGPCCTTGGVGASGSFAGSNAGGNGGDGGAQGGYIFPASGWTNDGNPGLVGAGPGAGSGGGVGVGVYATIISSTCDRTFANDGQAGFAGGAGTAGTAGLNGTSSFTGGYFIPGTGSNGADGANGSGGGGGGGGGAQGGLAYDGVFIQNTNGAGAGGSGGGEGGQGGRGGIAGLGGGGSFSIYIDNNGANGILRDCQFTFGSAGLGASGGMGGNGGIGGAGGALSGIFNCDIGAGGAGGDGGAGGAGGIGGSGDNGVAMDVYQDPNGTAANVLSAFSLQQPIVKVISSGCTSAPTTFTTTSTGTIEWFFGAGANPPTGNNQTSITNYTTTGRKTFTVVINGTPYTFTDFTDIYINGGGNVPAIISTSDTICVGDTPVFSSSIPASDYLWHFNGAANPDSATGPAFSVLNNISFNIPGTYNITLQTFSSCCGWSFADTFQVVVRPFILPNISITSSAQNSNNTICTGTNTMFAALTTDVGTNPIYQWLLNGNPAGLNNSSYVTNSLVDGDQISCVVTSSLNCASGMQDTSNTITIHISPPPVVTCASDSFIVNSPTYFNAAVTSGGISPFTYAWDFGDFTTGYGDSTIHIYTTSGSFVVNVVVTDSLGCTSACQQIISISTDVTAAYSASPITGCLPLTVNFTNQSQNAINYIWDFGDGNTSTQQDPSHTYYSPGSYNVSLTAFGIAGNPQTVVDTQIVVFATPIADFQAFPFIISHPGDTAFFADNSLGGITWNWNFGDPVSGANDSSTLQNPFHIYTSNGSYDVTLIVTNFNGCSDTIVKNNFVLMNVGIENIQSNEGINIRALPNPFTDQLYIQITSPKDEKCELTISDLTGRRIAELKELSIKSNISNEIPLSLNKIPVGVYILTLNTKRNSYHVKVVKN